MTMPESLGGIVQLRTLKRLLGLLDSIHVLVVTEEDCQQTETVLANLLLRNLSGIDASGRGDAPRPILHISSVTSRGLGATLPDTYWPMVGGTCLLRSLH